MNSGNQSTGGIPGSRFGKSSAKGHDSRYEGPMTSDYIGLLTRYVEGEARPVDKYGHQPRLEALTRQLGEGLEYDRDAILFMAY